MCPSDRSKRSSARAAAITRKKREGAAEVRPTLFLSYRHAPPASTIAEALRIALLPPADVWDADVFMDRHSIEPSDLFDDEIVNALNRTTHFVVLLNNDYWTSPYCRKEMARAVERFEAGEQIKLLFVKVQDFELNHFVFKKDRATGRINSDRVLLEGVGDVQFLGPFNRARQLVRLEYENDAVLSDQIAELVREIGRVIA